MNVPVTVKGGNGRINPTVPRHLLAPMPNCKGSLEDWDNYANDFLKTSQLYKARIKTTQYVTIHDSWTKAFYLSVDL